MDKEIVIVLPPEVAAYEAVKALKEIDVDGSIELYSSTVTMKAPDGAITIKGTGYLQGP